MRDRKRLAVAGSDNVRISDAFKNGYVWLCFVMVLCFAFSFSCYTSEIVAYLQTDVGMDPAAAQSWNEIGRASCRDRV